jgi:hypothetical protein
VDAAVELDDEIDGATLELQGAHEVVDERLFGSTRRYGASSWLSTGSYLKGTFSASGLEEEVERVVRGELGDEVDVDRQMIGRLLEDDAREPVALRVLVPIEEVVAR